MSKEEKREHRGKMRVDGREIRDAMKGTEVEGEEYESVCERKRRTVPMSQVVPRKDDFAAVNSRDRISLAMVFLATLST